VSHVAPSVVLLAVASLIACPSWAVGLLPGDILVLGTSEAGSGIIHVDPHTHAQSLVSPHGTASFGDFTVASNGEIFAVVGDSVVRVDPGSGARTPISAGGILTMPSKIAAGGGDDLFILDRQPAGAGEDLLGRIVRVDRNTGEQSTLLESSILDFHYNDMVYSDDGRLIVSDSCYGRSNCAGNLFDFSFNTDIVSVDPGTGEETLLYRSSDHYPSGLPHFIAIGKGSSTSEILVSTGPSSFSEGLFVFDTETGEFTGLFGGIFDLPSDAAADEEGRAIVARHYGSDFDPFVRELTRYTRETGEFERLVLGSFTEVELVPATAIPEPGSGALLAVGLSLLAVWRRHASPDTARAR
jgi:hypothetical protein